MLVLAGLVTMFGSVCSSTRKPFVQVRINAEPAAKLVPLRPVEVASSNIPVEYTKPDRVGASRERAPLDSIEDRPAPALTSSRFFDGEL